VASSEQITQLGVGGSVVGASEVGSKDVGAPDVSKGVGDGVEQPS